MREKGYTLIEVILALGLIGLIAASFLPSITFGVKNTFKAQEFTDTLYEYQDKVEGQIASLRDTDPDGSTTVSIFGKTIAGHNIHVDDDSSGEIYMFLPKKAENEPIPVIKSPPVIDIRKGLNKVTPVPGSVNLSDGSINLFVNEIEITTATKDAYLMSVYRWYMSTEMDITETPSSNPNQYFIIKEWNEAKKQLAYADSVNLKFIPNIKDKYNIMVFSDIKDGLGLSDEDFINSFGNRYIRYGVTPFSVRGRIGKEELSNAIYISAPRIELLHAVYASENRVILTFKENISTVVDIGNIVLNESIGQPKAAYRDTSNPKRLILEFDSLDSSSNVDGNTLLRGAVQSEAHGKVSIWYNNIPGGEFTIYDAPPVPVTSVSIVKDKTSIVFGDSYGLTVNVGPIDATNKKIKWTSADSSILSVDEDGIITGIAVGGPVKIKAASVDKPSIYDEISITVLQTEDMVVAELEEKLADKKSLTVTGQTNSQPQIVAPNDDDGIVYTLTDSTPKTGSPRITINNSKNATVTRGSSDSSGTITLTATKNGYPGISVSKVFTVNIPRSRTSGRGAVTVTE
ncbi:Ig-like domain-containing protein [Sedimentibacter sp.]|uniref:Ig-like domain-containing protein n=1 Tax=Sedimentibacter sp. TaxID=1960295 RepID=UPI00289F630E|nr:Ig-like domain-containing protein [Sedimentibacter sp.]